MRRHSACPTCSCEQTLIDWAADNLIPTPGVNTMMHLVTSRLGADHPHLMLTQQALTGRLRALRGPGWVPLYPIKNIGHLAHLIDHTLKGVPAS